ncbi:MAG: hypothetical protein CM1200mP27_12360 [Chloroflexota bacterium]|nr:MAG: hypothetical protein CM1200mP27_12360 [Chloroflexota bacterium]
MTRSFQTFSDIQMKRSKNLSKERYSEDDLYHEIQGAPDPS